MPLPLAGLLAAGALAATATVAERRRAASSPAPPPIQQRPVLTMRLATQIQTPTKSAREQAEELCKQGQFDKAFALTGQDCKGLIDKSTSIARAMDKYVVGPIRSLF